MIILNFIKNNYKKIFFIFICLFITNIAFAQQVISKQMQETLNLIVQLLNALITMMAFITGPLLMLAWWLLTPDWTYWDVFWLRDVLHSLWVLVSNVVYVIFAIMLVVIAFVSIIHENKNFWIKENLPKILVWILMVPFSWFIVSGTLSITNVLTASIITLPYDIIQNINTSWRNPLSQIQIPKKYIWKLSDWITWSWSFSSEPVKCESDNTNCTSVDKILSWENSTWVFNILSFYAYWIFKIQSIQIIDKTTQEKIKSIVDIIKHVWIWIIFFVVFAILIIAIVFALFYRACMMWLFIIFSPIFWLIFFLSWKPWEFVKSLEKFKITQFISLAMVPVYLSWALAFWFLFLLLAMKWWDAVKGNTYNSEYFKIDGENNNQTIDFWGVKLQMEWFWSFLNVAGDAKDLATWAIWNVIINILALIILWFAVMAALKSSEITKTAVQPIADFGASMWKLALKMPQYMPIPIPWTWKSMPLAWLQQLQSVIQWDFDNKASQSGRDVAEMFWFNQSENTKKMTAAYENNRSRTWDSLEKFIKSVNFNDLKSEEKKIYAEYIAYYTGLAGEDRDKFINNIQKSTNADQASEHIYQIIKNSSKDNVTVTSLKNKTSDWSKQKLITMMTGSTEKSIEDKAQEATTAAQEATTAATEAAKKATTAAATKALTEVKKAQDALNKAQDALNKAQDALTNQKTQNNINALNQATDILKEAINKLNAVIAAPPAPAPAPAAPAPAPAAPAPAPVPPPAP